MDYRVEHDTMGEVRVPADKLWGAQTQRSKENFPIGTEKMPLEVIRAFAIVKKCAAQANKDLGMLESRKAEVIGQVCDEILAGELDDQFPLSVWQTGSGTQSNMNVNEVIANRGNQIVGEQLLHPNDDVNKSQSSNDTFPTAMHIAAAYINEEVCQATEKLAETFHELAQRHDKLVKTGRTHLQDATPITFGQEVSAWAIMLDHNLEMIRRAQEWVYKLALGGTAVGTGLNAHKDFAVTVAGKIAQETGRPFVTAENKFHALTSLDPLCNLHGSYKALAANLMKIANDIRWLASGPRCGIGEITIPENEPGSSIMPGKVNPTQAEALTMVCAQVMGNDTTIGIAASQGNFQLNVYLPVTIMNFLQSGRLLADGMNTFNKNCASGIQANEKVMQENLNKSLMLVTALNRHIGYENAAKIAKYAYQEGITLKESAVNLGLLTGEEFEEYVQPKEMVHPLL